MTTLPGITNSNSTATSAASAAATSSSADYDTFLKLLVTQLKNQDPTKPMDSTEYLSQLATFSGVEQSIQTNNKLDQLLTSSAIEQANQLIGRTITSADGGTTGEVESVRITSQGLYATLTDGSVVQVGAGVVIS